MENSNDGYSETPSIQVDTIEDQADLHEGYELEQEPDKEAGVDTIDQRLMPDNGDDDAMPVGGSFQPDKKASHILRFSCINQNGIKPSTVHDAVHRD